MEGKPYLIDNIIDVDKLIEVIMVSENEVATKYQINFENAHFYYIFTLNNVTYKYI